LTRPLSICYPPIQCLSIQEAADVTPQVGVFDTVFGRFSGTVLEKVRLETYGEDSGQFCCLTADEYRHFPEWLDLGPHSGVLDIASGSGGPALFVARTTGAQVVGIGINEKAKLYAAGYDRDPFRSLYVGHFTAG
jgi:SAM-dependent methyltransferase